MIASIALAGVWLDGPELLITVEVTPEFGYWQIEFNAAVFELCETDDVELPYMAETHQFPSIVSTAGAPDEVEEIVSITIDGIVNRWVAMNRAFDPSFELHEFSRVKIAEFKSNLDVLND